jgi:nicotinamidase-related amidase
MPQQGELLNYPIPKSESAAQAQARSPWSGVIPPEEEAIYAAAGFGRVSGAGKRPALLVIDVQYRTIGERPAPIREALKQYPTSCGEIGWRTIPHTAQLIAAFRRHGFPVIYPHVAPKTINDGGRFADKAPSVMSIPQRGYEFVKEVAPEPNDIRIPKHHASAFFGTALTSHLVNHSIDTVFVAGCTTSGCVRASVVDASSFGFKVVVPEECVYDRSQISHAVNLFDMASKYADVVAVRDAIALVDACGQSMAAK